jgi:DUF971 family protein
MPNHMPTPTELTVHQKSRLFDIAFDDAVKPLFTDGHDSGIYTWDFLYKLGSEHAALWADYMARLHAAGFEGDSGREPGTVLPGAPVRTGGCGGHSH